MSHSPEKMRFAGLIIAMLLVVTDQWSKMMIFAAARDVELPYTLFSWFNIVLVANRGVSFGMFAHTPSYMPWLLTGGTSAIVLVLLYWQMQAREGGTITALSFIIGGAIGNIVDRVRLRAVTDFIDWHYQDMHWPAFNLADSFIFIGVVILVLISIVRRV